MNKLVRVRSAMNREKREMLKKGTPYRRVTAVYSSRLLNDLVSSNYTENITRDKLVEEVKQRYNVNDERAYDVAKNVDVHYRSIDDRVRLADYYQKAEEMLKGIN